jgi:signal transduction histidine kinase
MARDLHDTLAQGLMGIVLQLESAEQTSHDEIEDVRKHISRASSLARENLEQVRRSVMALGPLENEDLDSSLNHLVESMRPSMGTRVEFVLQGTSWPLRQGIKEGLLRIAQQALTNALQHAKANKIQLRLAFNRKQVSLQVTDDGVGFLMAKRPLDRVGLKSMQHRAKELGGKLQVKSRPGRGTSIMIEVSREQAVMVPNESR